MLQRPPKLKQNILRQQQRLRGCSSKRQKTVCLPTPQYRLEILAQETELTVPDLKDALFELSAFLKESHGIVLVQPSLVTEFDRYWKTWNAADDALRLAADIANDPAFPSACNEITERYGWEPRRLNPAITYLLDRGMLSDYKVLNSKPFVTARVVGKEDPIRRFVKSRC
ncbi:MAG: hypothetical protein MH208_14410 [Marinobacter sp.]|nr:hypothetical protein [Marinobacter sp.]